MESDFFVSVVLIFSKTRMKIVNGNEAVFYVSEQNKINKTLVTEKQFRGFANNRTENVERKTNNTTQHKITHRRD